MKPFKSKPLPPNTPSKIKFSEDTKTDSVNQTERPKKGMTNKQAIKNAEKRVKRKAKRNSGTTKGM